MERICCWNCEEPFESGLLKNVFEIPIKMCGGFGTVTVFSNVMVEVCDDCLEKHGIPVEIYEGTIRFEPQLSGLLGLSLRS